MDSRHHVLDRLNRVRADMPGKVKVCRACLRIIKDGAPIISTTLPGFTVGNPVTETTHVACVDDWDDTTGGKA